jgi:predicted ATPase/DNA-binding CsgD family transcriptional regulator
MSDNTEFPLVEPLSERERAILRLLADGLTNREIGDRLYLSHETVKWYNTQIYGKLSVSNRTQAASQARVRGLLDGDGLSLVGATARPRHNLPAQVTTFIGREQQISEIAGLIRDKSVRLVTLSGPGGVGKTRLAVEVATDLSSEFDDGIYLVNLAPIRQPERVADTIASTLELEVPPEKSASKFLATYLRERRMLLLVDNFEQVLEAAPLLVNLLSAAPELKFLATSREALGIYGETEYPVPPLSLPKTNQVEAISNSLQYESIALFSQRAGAAKPQFRISEQNLQPVSEICVRLDGLPLAIELAAARVKRLAPSDLLNQLNRSVAALKTGPRGIPDRHRTLQATITWSYDLLDDAEKALFASLSVFRGGFTLGAAEQVSGGRVPIGIEDLLESLVNKNLLIQHGGSDEESRFGMLETIHEYARGRLAQGEEEEECRRRHADYFTGLAERAEPKLQGAEQGYWYGRIEADYENIRSALAWTLGGGDRELGLRLVAALRDFWHYQGPSMDGLRWIEIALENLEQASPALRASVEICAGHTLMDHGRLERGSALLADSLAIYRELGDQQMTAWALAFLSFSSVGQAERYEEALALCDEGLSLFRMLDDRAGLAQALTIKGELARARGDLDLAVEAYKEGLELARESVDRRRESIQYVNLGMVEQSRGNFAEAEAYLQRCLRLAWEIRFIHIVAFVFAALVGPLGSRGNPLKAALLLGASEALYDKSGTMPEAVDQPAIENYIAVVQGKLSEEAFKSAYSEGRLMDLEDAVTNALEGSSK